MLKKQVCYNCNRNGHAYNNCLFPVMSYGGIMYQMRDDPRSDDITNKIPYYLMVQRTYTPDFKELIRGKFNIEDDQYIRILIGRITLQEINFMYTYTHKTLYQNIQKFCKIKKNKQYYLKYRQAKDNYNRLFQGTTNSRGIFLKFSDLVKENNPTYYLEPDWGFPKGRRNFKGIESDVDCAIREIQEETGITPDQYAFKSYYYVTEVHHGSNNIKYAHRYYLAKCNDDINCYIDPFNKHQAGEIRKLGWFTIEQSLAMIRPFHIEKKKVLLRVHREITGQVLVFDFTNENKPILLDKNRSYKFDKSDNSNHNEFV